MITAIALLVAAILTLLGALHVAWAFKASPLSAAVIPTDLTGSPVFVPSRGLTLAVAALLFVAAGLMVERVGLGLQFLPPPLTKAGTIGVSAVLLLRGIGDFTYVGLFRSVRSTPFARNDERFYTPLVLVLAAIVALVALRAR